MAPTFSNSTITVNITATLPAQANGWTITEGDVRHALAEAARDAGVPVSDLSVTLTPGERTVTMTESEYNSLRAGNSGA